MLYHPFEDILDSSTEFVPFVVESRSELHINLETQHY